MACHDMLQARCGSLIVQPADSFIHLIPSQFLATMASSSVTESSAAAKQAGNSAASSAAVAPPAAVADPRPYKCEVDVKFSSPVQAKHAMDVLSVDGELGDKVVKSFAIVPAAAEDGSCSEEGGVIMRVSFEATEAKMLRVSLSTFYDLLKVVLKCYQEFDHSES